MSTTLAAASAQSAYWYLTRSTGAVALVLLTLTVGLGILDTSRWSSPRWPRFVVDAVHRDASLLVLVFLALHIATSVLDGFASISLVDAVVPFVGRYRPFWLGLGALSFDLLVAVAVTSMLRARLGHGAWRAAHWLAYACWPIALVHALGTGSDVTSSWLQALGAVCVVAFIAAVAARAVAGWTEHAGRSAAALVALALVPVGLVAWLPAGPLGRGWARRSGTPPSLLKGSAAPVPAAPSGGHAPVPAARSGG